MSKSCGISNNCRRKHAHIHSVTDPTTEEVILISCGTVISDGTAENRPERSIIDINELYSGSRTGMPMSLAIHDLGDYRTRTRSSKDQNCIYAFHQLNKLKEKLVLPSSVIEKAAYIYREAQRNEIVKGRTRTGAITACVYIACREAAIPRGFNEVAEVSNIRPKEMWKAYRAIVSELGLKVPLIDPVNCLIKLANKTGVNEKVKRCGIDCMN